MGWLAAAARRREDLTIAIDGCETSERRSVTMAKIRFCLGRLAWARDTRLDYTIPPEASVLIHAKPAFALSLLTALSF